MADNFLAAIQTGIQMGHAIDSAKMQRAQMERMAAQMQMEAVNQAMQVSAFQQAQQEKTQRKAIFAPETTKPGGDEYTGPMAESVPGGPGREALKAQFPDSYNILADQMLNFGKIDPGYATLVKASKPDKPLTGFTLGDTRYEYGPDGKPVATVTNPKEKAKTIRTVDLGDKVEVYEDGVLTRTETKGKSPGTEGTAKPQQTSFTDPATGQPLIFDPKTASYRVSSVEGNGGVAPKPANPSATERERTASFNVLQDQIARIEKQYKPRFVGLISGQLGRVTQWGDSNEAEFRQIILDVKDSLLRARSGAQINEQEYARLAKLVPDFTDSEAQFKGKMTAFKTTLQAISRERGKSQATGGAFVRGTPSKVGRFTVEVE